MTAYSNQIPYSHQSIDDSDIRAVERVLRSPYLTAGPVAGEFEEAVCARVEARHAVAVCNCTAALHLAMMALGVGPEDEVWVSAVSFVASANCARYQGARVEFLDVEPHSGNLDVEALAARLAEAERVGRLPRVIVAVHLSGRPVELLRLQELRVRYGFRLIEDAAHALGSVYHGLPVGSCTYSDITVFSFHPVKIITCGEGGMCLTNDDELARKIRLLSSHGIERDEPRLQSPGRPAYYYEMQFLGFNYRMNELQAALGLSQLKRLDELVGQRRAQAARYFELLADCGELLGLPPEDSDASVSAWHLYQVRIGGGKRDAVFNTLRHKGIGVQLHYRPIYAMPYYQQLRPYPPLPGAESFSSEALSIPLFPGLTTLNQQFVAANLMAALDG